MVFIQPLISVRSYLPDSEIYLLRGQIRSFPLCTGIGVGKAVGEEAVRVTPVIGALRELMENGSNSDT